MGKKVLERTIFINLRGRIMIIIQSNIHYMSNYDHRGEPKAFMNVTTGNCCSYRQVYRVSCSYP